MKLKTQDGEDDEYVPVDIHKEENMKQQKRKLWLVYAYLF